MPFLDAIRLALAQIRVQKLKSFFTLLGVMIGVMFLITVVSIVEGMSRYVEEDFAARLLGVNTFTLRRRPFVPTGGRNDVDAREYQRRPRLTMMDAQAVRAALPRGTRSAIENLTFSFATVAGGSPKQVQAVATEPDYFRIKKYNIVAGRVFTQQEADLGIPVVVIGQEVVDAFFTGLDPIGREVRIGGMPYRVIGTIEKQGTVLGFSLDRLAIAPVRSPLSRVTNPGGDISGLVVQTDTREDMDSAMESAREAMRAFRGLKPAQKDNFSFESPDQALAFFDGIKSKLIVFGTALPAIGLIVGALVIMNIMLVAVAERTREIGVRKALGAKRRDIMSQFLVESATLSLIGAAVGIALGLVLAQVIAAFSPLPAAVAPWAIAVALTLGMGVGVVAGLYPASRAARLDPIAALRQE